MGTAAEQKQQTQPSDYQQVKRLMKEMGARSGFDPLPPDQHKWQAAKDEPPLHRIWAWMCAHTIHWGHRSAFAVSREKHELHLEHIAADLDMDEGNVRRTWRDGVRKGLWRNGTEQEGPRKLFLCGEVKPQATEGEEKAEEVCTDLLPPYITKQIKELPEQKQEEFWRGYKADLLVQKRVHADVTAAVRLIFDGKQDSRFQAFGIKKIREQHAKAKKPGAGAQASQQPANGANGNGSIGRDRLQPLLPAIEGFVQTVAESVQTQIETSYKAESGAVQTAASLLPAEAHRKGQRMGAGAASDGPGRHRETRAVDGEKRFNQLPSHAKPIPNTREEAENPENGSAALPAEADALFREIAHMQRAYAATDFGKAPFCRENPGIARTCGSCWASCAARIRSAFAFMWPGSLRGWMGQASQSNQVVHRARRMDPEASGC